MKLLPCYILALACSGAIAGTPAGERGPHMGPGMGMPQPAGVALSEAQEKKAFAIRHAAEPFMFEQTTALRKAHDTLRQLADAPQFDEAKAGAAASAAGNASAALALSQARIDSQMRALLTPEQRAEAAQRRPRPPAGPSN